ncbi:MAG: Asp-tRNA(Asn)/Glu-tRNA(Gln) amidotransferase subunit GatC, partial [Gammaproteobacteria bacterium]
MSDIDIDHLCRLARLALDPAETTAVRADLARIIAMVDEMQAIDTTGVAPLAH